MEEDPAIKIKEVAELVGYESVYLFQGLQAVLSCLTKTGSRRLTGILPKRQNIDSIFEKGTLKWNIRNLGKSDVLVSELILGCWAMGGDYFGATEDKSSLEALEVSYENGVNTFDTAEIYGDGRSERVVGEAARRIGRDKVRIISKVFKPSMSHDKMIKACEDSLQRWVPIGRLLFTLSGSGGRGYHSGKNGDHGRTEKAGKIRAIGLSNFSLGRDEGGYAIWTGRCDSALLPACCGDTMKPCWSLAESRRFR